MKTITVMTNDSSNPSINLTVSGNVEKFVTINPPVVRFNGKIGEELKSEIKIIPEKKYPLTILKISSQETAKNIKYELKEGKSDSGEKEYLVKVENLKKDAGFYYDVLILETDSKIQPEIRVNVMARIIDPNQQNPPLNGINGNIQNNNGGSVKGDVNNKIPFATGNSQQTDANGDKNNNFLDIIKKLQQQNEQAGKGSNPKDGSVNPSPVEGSSSADVPIQDPKRAEELKKKFEELIKQAQEKQKSQEASKTE